MLICFHLFKSHFAFTKTTVVNFLHLTLLFYKVIISHYHENIKFCSISKIQIFFPRDHDKLFECKLKLIYIFMQRKIYFFSLNFHNVKTVRPAFKKIFIFFNRSTLFVCRILNIHTAGGKKSLSISKYHFCKV